MEHTIHREHTHKHEVGCGHKAFQHGNHIDYIHDGHLHREHEGHYDECSLEVSDAYPSNCTEGHGCKSHDSSHVHGIGCGHEAVPHGDHIDYLVDGHLHHPHNGHCDHHGVLALMGK